MIFASVLLALIFAGALLNLRYLNHYIGELQGTLRSPGNPPKPGIFPAPRKNSGRPSTGGKPRGYTHIFIRHSELDSATDAFYECCGIYTRGTSNAMVPMRKSWRISAV
jgi:hypothetical protein